MKAFDDGEGGEFLTAHYDTDGGAKLTSLDAATPRDWDAASAAYWAKVRPESTRPRLSFTDDSPATGLPGEREEDWAVPDPVNHPSHYNSDPSGVECIQITRHRTFNIGNAMKYLWRAGLKDEDAVIQDLEKAVWYIRDEIKRLEET